ncbi:hypothetical protein HYS91_03760 [Candidatus Daviesbacteria bacterium]|nr:hypothetical protein [Candidatus Daviesbacteria bacterium]
MRRYSRSYTPRSIRKREGKVKKKFIFTTVFAFFLFSLVVLWGLPTLISGLSVFNILKPKTEALNEVDVALAPPVLNIPFDATNSANIKFSGFTQPEGKVNIYLDDKKVETVVANLDGRFETGFIELSLGTNNIIGKTVNEEGQESLPSKTIQVIYQDEKPKLEVLEPADGIEIEGEGKKVKVSGVTDLDNELTINGNKVIINFAGNFSLDINLNDGENTIIINATNGFGNSTQIQRKVTYTP